MTLNEDTDAAVLMPLASIIAIGSGVQGRSALHTWGGVSVAEFEDGFGQLLSALEADPESMDSARVLGAVADAAARAHAWLHITTNGPPVEHTYLVLQAPDESIVLGIHGDIVEWVVGGHEVLDRCLASLLDDSGGAVTLLTCFDATTPVAGLRFSGGAVDVTAAHPEVFEALTTAARSGLDALSLALASPLSTTARS